MLFPLAPEEPCVRSEPVVANDPSGATKLIAPAELPAPVAEVVMLPVPEIVDGVSVGDCE